MWSTTFQTQMVYSAQSGTSGKHNGLVEKPAMMVVKVEKAEEFSKIRLPKKLLAEEEPVREQELHPVV